MQSEKFKIGEGRGFYRRAVVFFDNLAGLYLAEMLNRYNGRQEGAGFFRTGKIRNAAGPMWKYPEH